MTLLFSSYFRTAAIDESPVDFDVTTKESSASESDDDNEQDDERFWEEIDIDF